MDKIMEELANKIDDILFHFGDLDGYKNYRCTEEILIAVVETMAELMEKSVEDIRKAIGH